jgi:hypothetical protein
MADLMAELQKALTDLGAKKKVLDKASAAVQTASMDYESSVGNVRKLRNELNESVNAQLMAVGVGLTDPRVNQSS